MKSCWRCSGGASTPRRPTARAATSARSTGAGGLGCSAAWLLPMLNTRNQCSGPNVQCNMPAQPCPSAPTPPVARSTGIYWHTEEQRAVAEASKAAQNERLGGKVATEVEQVTSCCCRLLRL